MESLAQRIKGACQPSSWTDGGIIAIGDLREIWTNNALRNTVVSRSLTNTEIRFAQEHLLRTISLLVYIRFPDASQVILGLIESKKRFDENLHVVRANDLDLSLEQAEQDFFLAARPLFTAPVLTEGEDMTLEGAQEMPLIGSREPEALGSGMNGIVIGQTIPRGHLKRRDGSNPQGISVAVKTLQRNSDVAQQEINILRRLRDLLRDGEIQICACITTVTKRLEVHSLSLRATSNLKDKLLKLQTSYRGSFNRGRLMASIQQIKGIVEAVAFLHNNESNGLDTCYCHMDIKPENILVFDSNRSSIVGEWRLIDFGITTISDKKKFRTDGGSREEQIGPHTTITVGTTARSMASRYQPPEINNNIPRIAGGESGTYMGRGSDVWSLACVFAEVVAANLGELGDMKNNIRNYFYEETKLARTFPVLPRNYRRHRSFDHWLKKLRRHGESEPALELCHELISKMTHMKRIRRLKSQQVLERMGEISEVSGGHPANAPTRTPQRVRHR
ncbi:kinase-like domain-containing protein [Xylaria castorea]|nr:kinase-like domain-containing protein [Xylaria castorea]